MSWTQTGVLAMTLHAAGVKRNATQTEKKQRKKAHHPVNGRESPVQSQRKRGEKFTEHVYRARSGNSGTQSGFAGAAAPGSVSGSVNDFLCVPCALVWLKRRLTSCSGLVSFLFF